MKRRELVRHLETEGCVLAREGGKHSVYYNPLNGQNATVARHTDIWPAMARAICKQLGIATPKKK